MSVFSSLTYLSNSYYSHGTVPHQCTPYVRKRVCPMWTQTRAREWWCTVNAGNCFPAAFSLSYPVIISLLHVYMFWNCSALTLNVFDVGVIFILWGNALTCMTQIHHRTRMLYCYYDQVMIDVHQRKYNF